MRKCIKNRNTKDNERVLKYVDNRIYNSFLVKNKGYSPFYTGSGEVTNKLLADMAIGDEMSFIQSRMVSLLGGFSTESVPNMPHINEVFDKDALSAAIINEYENEILSNFIVNGNINTDIDVPYESVKDRSYIELYREVVEKFPEYKNYFSYLSKKYNSKDLKWYYATILKSGGVFLPYSEQVFMYTDSSGYANYYDAYLSNSYLFDELFGYIGASIDYTVKPDAIYLKQDGYQLKFDFNSITDNHKLSKIIVTEFRKAYNNLGKGEKLDFLRTYDIKTIPEFYKIVKLANEYTGSSSVFITGDLINNSFGLLEYLKKHKEINIEVIGKSADIDGYIDAIKYYLNSGDTNINKLVRLLNNKFVNKQNKSVFKRALSKIIAEQYNEIVGDIDVWQATYAFNNLQESGDIMFEDGEFSLLEYILYHSMGDYARVSDIISDLDKLKDIVEDEAIDSTNLQPIKRDEFIHNKILDIFFNNEERKILNRIQKKYPEIKFRFTQEGLKFKFNVSDRVIWNQFVGVTGNLDRIVREKLLEAIVLDKRGKDMREILKLTGWQRAKDGSWKYIITNGHIKKSGIDKLKNGYAAALHEVIDNNELFKIYPQLKEINVLTDVIKSSAIAAYNKGFKTIVIDTKFLHKHSYNDHNISTVFFHEIQHAIQDIENWASGSNTSSVLDEITDNENKYLIGLLKEEINKNIERTRMRSAVIKYILNTFMYMYKEKYYRELRKISDNFKKDLNISNDYLDIIKPIINEDGLVVFKREIGLKIFNKLKEKFGDEKAEYFKDVYNKYVKKIRDEILPHVSDYIINSLIKNFGNTYYTVDTIKKDLDKALLIGIKVIEDRYNMMIEYHGQEIDRYKKEIDKMDKRNISETFNNAVKGGRFYFLKYRPAYSLYYSKLGEVEARAAEKGGNDLLYINDTYDGELPTWINADEVAYAGIVGQADIMAGTVLIDASKMKEGAETVLHEYAHHYIEWNKNSEIVKEALKKWADKDKPIRFDLNGKVVENDNYRIAVENLVQAIGEQAVKQNGEAWEWWKKFVRWILDGLKSLSNIEKDELKNILTDAFLNRANLEKYESYFNNTKYINKLSAFNIASELANKAGYDFVIGDKYKHRGWALPFYSGNKPVLYINYSTFNLSYIPDIAGRLGLANEDYMNDTVSGQDTIDNMSIDIKEPIFNQYLYKDNSLYFKKSDNIYRKYSDGLYLIPDSPEIKNSKEWKNYGPVEFFRSVVNEINNNMDSNEVKLSGYLSADNAKLKLLKTTPKHRIYIITRNGDVSRKIKDVPNYRMEKSYENIDYNSVSLNKYVINGVYYIEKITDENIKYC